MVKVLSVALFALLLPAWSAAKECHADVKPGGDFKPDASLCQPQGPGQYTFSMATSLASIGVPLTLGGSTVSGTSFVIFDASCRALGRFDPPTCGIPWHVEAAGLKYVIVVKHVAMDVGDPYFEFNYANGKYSIGNNHCGCKSASGKSPKAEKECKCAFPVDGEPHKRSIAFEA